MSDQTRPPSALKAFKLRCEALALQVSNLELDRSEAANRMQRMAEGYGLVENMGQDWVQNEIITALANGAAPSADEIEQQTIANWDRAEAEAEAKRVATKPQQRPIIIRTAAELRCKEFAPIKYVVRDYIVEGLTLLAGRPKLGKSWLMLDIGLAVARGETCLSGVKCQQGDVLYLALEDNERRLQNRMTRLLGYAHEWPECFHYVTEWPRADAGGLEEIRKWITTANKPRLVVVDILAMFRPRRRKDQQPYEADYEAIQALQAIASETGVAIVIVHHLRKSAGEVDPFEKVSGTLGLSGAADTVLILDRDSQGATLYGRGRDIEEIESAVQFSRETCRWQILGVAAEVRRTDERTVILDVLKDATEPMTPKDILIAAELTNRNALDQLLYRMAKAGDIEKAGRGQYSLPGSKISKIGKIDEKTSVNSEPNQSYGQSYGPPPEVRKKDCEQAVMQPTAPPQSYDLTDLTGESKKDRKIDKPLDEQENSSNLTDLTGGRYQSSKIEAPKPDPPCPQIREGEHAILVDHCALFGRRETKVRKFKVSQVKPYAQYDKFVDISVVEPKRRRGKVYEVYPCDHTFYTIERDGRVIYDSRIDIPCDMIEWRRVREEHKAHWLAGKAGHEKFMAERGGGVSIDSGYGADPWEKE
jgi:RecA-family ATPase